MHCSVLHTTRLDPEPDLVAQVFEEVADHEPDKIGRTRTGQWLGKDALQRALHSTRRKGAASRKKECPRHDRLFLQIKA